MRLAPLLFVLSALPLACFQKVDDKPDTAGDATTTADGNTNDATSETTNDVATTEDDTPTGDDTADASGPTFEALRSELDAARIDLTDGGQGVSALYSGGTRIYAMTSSERWFSIDSSGERVNYSINFEGHVEFGGDVLVESTDLGDGTIRYRAFDATAADGGTPLELVANVPVDIDPLKRSTTFAVNGQKTVFYITADGAEANTAHRWVVGEVPTLSEFSDFPILSSINDVFASGTFSLAIASDFEFFTLDLSGGEYTGVGEQTDVQRILGRGFANLLYCDDGSIELYDEGRLESLDIAQVLGALGSVVPERGEDAHTPAANCQATLWEDTLVYVATDGLFAYELDTQTLRPLLLEGPDEQFLSPVVLENGAIYVLSATTSPTELGLIGLPRSLLVN